MQNPAAISNGYEQSTCAVLVIEYSFFRDRLLTQDGEIVIVPQVVGEFVRPARKLVDRNKANRLEKLQLCQRYFTCFRHSCRRHEVGAHYTYSLVPYDAWLSAAMGKTLSETLGLQRNHYDRLIHFAYGLLVLLPAVELLRNVAPPRGIWRHILPVLFILSNSAIYELIEWAAAMVFGHDLGTAYLGTQGDAWDSHKDMAAAGSGAVVAAIIIAGVQAVRRQVLDWRLRRFP